MTISSKHTQIIWTDYVNITRTRIFPNSRFHDIIKIGASVTSSILSLPLMYDVAIESPVGEVSLVPVTSPVQVPWAKGLELTFGEFQTEGKEWELCPRTFLRNQVKKLEQEDIKATIGFEIEFMLFHADEKQEAKAADTTLYCETKALNGDNWLVLAEIVDTLETLSIPVWQFHPESAHGQFEVAIGPFEDLVHAADSLVLARQTIYNISQRYGFKATLLPKPYSNQAGNAAHVHMSLQTSTSSSINLFEVEVKKANAFLSGILNHLPSLMTIYTPTVNSFNRIQPSCWAGAYQCIGTENKEAPIRLIKKKNIIERFELKAPDGTSNPYLVIGSMIISGLNGIKQSLILPQEVNVNPHILENEQKPKRLPISLKETLELFKNNLVLKTEFGERMHGLIVALKREEEDYYSNNENPGFYSTRF